MTPEPIRRWHAYIDQADPAVLEALLDDAAVFESPVVHTPQVGKAITLKYLLGAANVLNGEGFRYPNEWYGDNSAILEFASEVDGVKINGVDMIWWNDAGLITHFKVMIRPLKAINLLHQKMGAMLASMSA